MAALPGTVTEVGYDGIYGNYVRMSHGTNIETWYCHCSEILVEEGSQLREGERIALSGSTGMTTGAHLHFEVLADGLLADPASVLEVHYDACTAHRTAALLLWVLLFPPAGSGMPLAGWFHAAVLLFGNPAA